MSMNAIPSLRDIMSDPIAITIELRRYLENFIYLTTGMYTRGTPGVYPRGYLQPILTAGQEFIVAKGECVLDGFTMDNIIQGEIPRGYSITTTKGRKIIDTNVLGGGFLTKYPNAELIAISAGYGILLDYLSDEFRLLPKTNLTRLNNNLTTQYLLPEHLEQEENLLCWADPLLDHVDNLIGDHTHNIIGMTHNGYIAQLCIYCDYRIYEWTQMKEAEALDDEYQ